MSRLAITKMQAAVSYPQETSEKPNLTSDYTGDREILSGRPGVLLAFGDYRLDIERRELRRGGEIVGLEPKAFDLLACLVRHRDRGVSKDDILQEVWGGRIVSEAALTTRINAVRRALGDDGTRSGWCARLPARASALSATSPNCRTSDASRHPRDRPDAAAGQTIDRGPAIPEHERRPGAGIFRRRHGRGDHHGAVSHPLAVRDRAQFSFTYKGKTIDVSRSAANSACATCWKARCVRAATGCASPHN